MYYSGPHGQIWDNDGQCWTKTDRQCPREVAQPRTKVSKIGKKTGQQSGNTG